MTTIRILPPDVAAKIAAGEVVERPASIVKELVENGIDAGATRITVDLQNGGMSVLRVTDNGGGIVRDELPLAFARHATSKIAAVDDLDVLQTLGFRGEALASIGAVADVTFAARPPDAPAGAQIAMQHGALGPLVAMAMAPGTIVTVRDLFAMIPARLKFLKSRQGEAGYCVQLVERYALAYPEIQFIVLNDGRLALRTPGDGNLTSAIAAVYDLKTAEQMVPIQYGGDIPPSDMDFVKPPIVTGMTSRPACFRSSKQHIHLFVNRRWVRSQTLTYAVAEAYHSLLLTGRHPVSVIAITLDPALVDVNVHPAKTEVKFARERQVYAAVQRAVRAAIIDTTEAPAISTHAFAVPGWPHPPAASPSDDGEGENDVSMPPIGSIAGVPSPTGPSPLWNEQAMRQAERATAPVQVAKPRAPQGLPALRVLGQVSQSYIITEGPDGVYLVDQHAAHERILLEKMVAQWRAKALPAQALLEPVVVELDPQTFAALEERLADLEQVGFAIEPFGAATVLVRAVPAPLTGEANAIGLGELLPHLVGADSVGHAETWEEHALANIACRSAIKAGQTLAPEEQRELVRQLEHVDARHSCCHGRPTTIHLSLDALEREFARR